MKANPIDRGQAMISDDVVDRTVAVLRNHFGDRLSYDDWWFVGEQIRAALTHLKSLQK